MTTFRRDPEAAQRPPLFEVEGVVFHYPGATAIDELSMTVEAGRSVALLGGERIR